MRRCEKTECILHCENIEGLNYKKGENYSNGCTALRTLYKKNKKCRFYKEKNDE